MRMLNQRFVTTLLLASVACFSVFAQSGPGINELKKLTKTDVKVGTGAVAEKNDLVIVEYTGRLKNGTVFDTNLKREGSPYGFYLGSLGVIEGWQQGIAGMRVGGVRKLEIPDELAYGKAGQGEKIPPYADLYFEIKVIHIVKANEVNVFDTAEIKKGTGKAVKEGDLVDVVYTAKLLNGRKFDIREDKTKPITFRVAYKKKETSDRIPIRGVAAGIVGMQVGGRRKITIPPLLAFGEMGRSGAPPHSVVIYEVEVLRIR